MAPLLRGSPAFPCVGSGLALEPRQADANYFRCGGASGQCIAVAQRCNGVEECADASDEVECDYAPCVTVGGPDRFGSCRLPFEYAGHTFHSCTRMDSPTGEAWCPTDVDAVGRYVSYAASGLCGPGCPPPLAAEAARSGLCDGPRRDSGHCAPPPSPPPSPPSPPPSPVSLLVLQALPGSSGAASALLLSLLAVLAMLAAALAGAGCWLVRKRSTIENLAADWESMRGHATVSAAARSSPASKKPHSDSRPITAVSSDDAATGGEEDEWYYLDASRRQVGPLPEQALRGLRRERSAVGRRAGVERAPGCVDSDRAGVERVNRRGEWVRAWAGGWGGGPVMSLYLGVGFFKRAHLSTRRAFRAPARVSKIALYLLTFLIAARWARGYLIPSGTS